MPGQRARTGASHTHAALPRLALLSTVLCWLIVCLCVQDHSCVGECIDRHVHAMGGTPDVSFLDVATRRLHLCITIAGQCFVHCMCIVKLDAMHPFSSIGLQQASMHKALTRLTWPRSSSTNMGRVPAGIWPYATRARCGHGMAFTLLWTCETHLHLWNT